MIHLGAHAVGVDRLYAISRISGVIGVVWALPAGLFLLAGGARRMSQPAWRPLLEFVSSMTLDTVPAELCYPIVGGVLALGGSLGIVGLAFTARWVSLLSAFLCTTWCVVTTGFLAMSNVNVEQGGNFLAFSIGLNCFTFLLRFLLLVGAPAPGKAVQLYERG